MTHEEQRRALLHLANAVNSLASALERVKPECITPPTGGLLGLGSSFESDLASVRKSLEGMLLEIGVGGPFG